MAASAADVINLDLEDSVAPADKPAARANIIRAIDEIDWGTKTLSVRINGLDTEFWYRDVVDILEQAGERHRPPHDPQGRHRRRHLRRRRARHRDRGGEGPHEEGRLRGHHRDRRSASHNVAEIAAASPRMQAMSLGAADFAASMGMQTTGIGGTQEDYYMLPPKEAAERRAPIYGDPWHGVTAAIVAACRAAGILPVDGPFGDFSDDEGFLAQARRAATMGMVGKWAIHPKQVALANAVFTPSEAQVSEARAILAAMQEAEAKGQGAAVYKGRLIDLASIRQAQVIVRQAEMIAG